MPGISREVERRRGARSDGFGRYAALAIALVMLAALFASPAADAHKSHFNKKKLKNQVVRKLQATGYDVKQILPCRKQGFTTYKCEWRVEGQYTQGPKYSCRGFATYLVRQHTIQLDPCYNAQLWDMLIAKGLNPTAILNGRFKNGVWSFEWRAEGTSGGSVPYRCQNVARFDTRTNQVTVGDCPNEVAPAVPLTDQPAPQPVFGFNDDWANQANINKIPLATAIGTSVIRFSINWATAEPQPNAFNFGPYDVLIRQMVAQGVRPFFVPIGAPCWAQSVTSGRCNTVVGPPSASHIDDFATFMATLATHYTQMFPSSPPFAIEVWNEPNWLYYWPPKPDPALYSSMVIRSADAIHATGTGVPVVVAGDSPLASSSSDNTKLSADSFMRQVFQAGGIGSADAVGEHVYFGAVDDYSLNMRQQIASLRQVLTDNGVGSLPIWITEYGISSSEETDAQGQATVLVDLYNTLRHIANIPVVIVHRFFEGTNDVGGGADHRGVVQADGTPKPAYCALGHATGVFPPSC